MNPNGNHTWKFCKCEVCGKINEFGFDWQHDWEEIEEDGYVRIRRCRICGKRDESKKKTIAELNKERDKAMFKADSLSEMRSSGIKC